ncbi:hypothetical protein Ais01nite_41060 [Asanoa ishikariensis]|nr:hypothetical protein Ais01nite_41060 [Asanoa ishikariensis]
MLPSPIPHPLETLPWEVPGWAHECLEWVIGVQWPDGDERAVWNVADAWYAASADLSTVSAESAVAASAVSAGYAGPAATAFADEWHGLETTLAQLPGAFTDLGAAVESCGAEIEAAKIEVWIEVVLLVIELLALAVAMALTAGAASPAAVAAAAATRAAIHRIFGRLVVRLSRPFGRVLLAGAAEAVEEAGTSAGIQSYQRAAGHRESFDLRAVGMSAVGGFAGGVAGSAVHLGPSPAAGLASKAGRSAASEALAETAASLATGGGLPDPTDAARAATSGATGGAVDHGLATLEIEVGSAASTGTPGDFGPAINSAIASPSPSGVEAGVAGIPTFGGVSTGGALAEAASKAGVADLASVENPAAPRDSETTTATASGPLRPALLGPDAPAAVDLASADAPGGNQLAGPPPAEAVGAPSRTSPGDAGVVAGPPQQPLSPPVVAGGASVGSLPPRPSEMLGDPTDRQLRAIGVGSATLADLGVDPDTLSAAERSSYERVLPKVALLRPDQIRFTQRSVSPAHEGPSTQVQANGWHGPPIHCVRWGDGSYVTLDNQRLRAAREAGLERIPVVVHSPSERLADWPMNRPATYPLEECIRELADGTWAVGGDEGKVRYDRGAVPLTYAEAAVFSAAQQHSLLPASPFGTESVPMLLAWSPHDLEVDLVDGEYSLLLEIQRLALGAADRVQADLESIANDSAGLGLTLVGTDHRVKDLASLIRKFESEARLLAPSIEATSQSLNDVLRFSILVSDDVDLASAVGHVLARLPDYGYEVEPRSIKNFWLSGNRYFGLNMTVRSSGGQLFELQFPTDASWRAGKLTHGLYEVMRKEDPHDHAASSARRVHAFLRMLSINRRLGLPDTVPSGLRRISEPRDTSFAMWILRKSDVWEGYKAWLDLNKVHFRDIAAEFDLGIVDFPIAPGLRLDDVDVQLLRDLRD